MDGQATNMLFMVAYRAALAGANDVAERGWTPLTDGTYGTVAPLAAFALGLLLAAQGDPVGARVAYQQTIDSGHADAAPLAAVNLGCC